MKNKRSCFLGLCLTFLVFSGLWAASDANDMYAKKLSYKTEVYNKTLQFVERNPNSPDAAKLWFNIAELSTQVEAENLPKIIDYYRKVIAIDPDFPDRDVVDYNIGYYSYRITHETIDNNRIAFLAQFSHTEDFNGKYPANLLYTSDAFKEAVNAFNSVITRYPSSRYASESFFRLGNLYFEIGYDNPDQTRDVYDPKTGANTPRNTYYQQAEEYFRQLAARDDDMSVYGVFFLGWTSFSAGDFDNAIRYFSATLDTIAAKPDPTIKTYFESNALKNIANSLMEFDTDYMGASSAADKFRETFYKMVTPEYGQQILKEAYKLKMYYRAPQQAIDFYNVYVTLYPDAIDAPSLIDSMINVAMTNEDLVANPQKVVFDQRKRLVDNYNLKSDWYAKNKDNDIAAQLAIVQKAFDQIELTSYNNAVDSPSDASYETYMTIADNYLSLQNAIPGVPATKHDEIRQRIMAVTYHKADAGKNPMDFWKARSLFVDYDAANPNGDSLFVFEKRAYDCSEAIYDLLKAQVATAPFVDEKAGVNWDKNDLDSIYVEASLRFEKVFTDPKYSGRLQNTVIVKILSNRAGVYYDRKQNDEAYSTYQTVLDKNPDDATKETAYGRMAEIAYSRGGQQNFQLAEDYYAKAAEITANADRKNAYTDYRRSAMQAKAESMSGAEAAGIYIKLAEENKGKDKELVKGYYNRAIVAYLRAGVVPPAIDLYLQMAAVMTLKEELTGAYARAYTLADSTGDYTRGEALRKELITKLNAMFPGSIEAFEVEKDIIDHYKGAPFNDKAKAAQLYLDLHNRAVATKMNLGQTSPADIYVNVIALNDSLGDESKLIQLMMDFDKLYPNDPRANKFLLRVADIYMKNHQDDKLNELAIYMYKKDPTLNLYVDIANNKIRENLEAAGKAFEGRDRHNLKPTIDSIANFKAQYVEMTNKYKANGLKLQYEVGFQQYDKFTQYFTYFSKLDKAIQDVENGYMKTEPQQLVRVVAQTTWNGQLFAGRKYPEKAIEAGFAKANELYKVLTDGLAQGVDVPTEDRTHIIYLCGRVMDYTAEAIARQIQRYIDISTEMKSFRSVEEEYQYALQTINGQSSDWQNAAHVVACKWYDLNLTTFCDNKDYHDDWTDKSLARMRELGQRTPKVNVALPSGSNWRVTDVPMTDVGYLQSGNWSVVNSYAPQTAPADYPDAQMMTVYRNRDAFVRLNFDLKMAPGEFAIAYLFEQPLEVYLNGYKVAAEPVRDTLAVDGVTYNRFQLSDTEDLIMGTNTLVLKVPQDTTKTKSTMLASCQVSYDQERFNTLMSAPVFRVMSDNTWMTTVSEIDPTVEIIPDSTWAPATAGKLGFNLALAGNLSNAKPIWAPQDSVASAWFYKEFEVGDLAMETGLRYLADQTVSIWMNQAPVVDAQEISVDPETGMKVVNHLSNLPVLPGKNTILIKVVGGEGSHGLLFDLTGITHKTE
jgi:hypothetical protein